MHSFSTHRSVGALLTTFIFALLLFLNGNIEPIWQLAQRRQPLYESISLFNSSSDTTAVANLSSHQHASPHSHPRLHSLHAINRRAPTLSYSDAIYKGDKLTKLVLDAFDGKHPAGQDFGPEDVKNGWTRESFPFPRPIPTSFKDPLKAIGKTLGIGERLPTSSETYFINLIQDQPFQNILGQTMQVSQHRITESFFLRRQNC